MRAWAAVGREAELPGEWGVGWVCGKVVDDGLLCGVKRGGGPARIDDGFNLGAGGSDEGTPEEAFRYREAITDFEGGDVARCFHQGADDRVGAGAVRIDDAEALVRRGNGVAGDGQARGARRCRGMDGGEREEGQEEERGGQWVPQGHWRIVGGDS